jgi:hypothetical protein
MCSTLSRWFQRQLRSGRASRLRRGSRSAFRPRLEALEERWVPTVLKISSSADDVNMIGTLRWAVAYAHDGDVIEILPYPWSGQARHITLTHGELLLNHSLTIESVGPEAAIDGAFSSRVFEVARGASVELDNLDISHGNAKANNRLGNNSLDGDGGGILNEGSLTINHCGAHDCIVGGGIYNYHGYLFIYGDSFVNHNIAGIGGGIYNDHGTLVMSDTALVDNGAGDVGGAIFNAGGQDGNAGGYAEIDHCTLVFNHALRGGGIANFGGDVQLNSTGLYQNYANLVGGALFNTAGVLTVDPDCTLKRNHAVTGGGGIFNNFGALYVTGSFLLYNTTKGDGGGIDSVGGSVGILSCHLENNSAGGVGGGIYDHSSKVRVTESHLDLNSALAGGGIYNDNGDLAVTDTELGYNFVSFFGGAIANFEGTVQVTGSQFTWNSAPVGAAIFNSLGTVRIGTTLFHPTPPDNIDGPWVDLGGNNFI